MDDDFIHSRGGCNDSCDKSYDSKFKDTNILFDNYICFVDC
jgi:hypothetical protein